MLYSRKRKRKKQYSYLLCFAFNNILSTCFVFGKKDILPSQKCSNRSLEKFLSLLMLFRKRVFCQESILPKKNARAFLRDQKSILSKRLSLIPLLFPLGQFSFYKEYFYKRAFLQESILHGCTREHFRRATKGQ